MRVPETWSVEGSLSHVYRKDRPNNKNKISLLVDIHQTQNWYIMITAEQSLCIKRVRQEIFKWSKILASPFFVYIYGDEMS